MRSCRSPRPRGIFDIDADERRPGQVRHPEAQLDERRIHHEEAGGRAPSARQGSMLRGRARPGFSAGRRRLPGPGRRSLPRPDQDARASSPRWPTSSSRDDFAVRRGGRKKHLDSPRRTGAPAGVRRPRWSRCPTSTTTPIEWPAAPWPKSLGLKPAALIHPARMAVSGKTKGAGLFEMMELLGQDESPETPAGGQPHEHAEAQAGQLRPRHHRRGRPGSRQEPGTRPHPLPAGAERLPPYRPRQVHLPQFRPGRRVRRASATSGSTTRTPRRKRSSTSTPSRRTSAGWGSTGKTGEFYASDYFEKLYEFAVDLIRKGQGLRLRLSTADSDPRTSAAR